MKDTALLHWHNNAWGHVLLSDLVPYCVAAYSASKNEMDRRAGR